MSEVVSPTSCDADESSTFDEDEEQQQQQQRFFEKQVMLQKLLFPSDDVQHIVEHARTVKAVENNVQRELCC